MKFSLAAIAPAMLGVITVGQGVVNRLVGERWGLTSAIVLNACVLLCVAGALFLAVRLQPEWFPLLFQGEPSLKTFRWWFLLPGVLGCIFITSIPFAISHFGAAHVFVMVVAGQMLASMGYDALFDGKPITPLRLGAALLAVGAAVLIGLDSSGRS